jgi:hypothetical protein
MELTVALYVLGLVALAYMIYRYARYTPWRSTPIGRAFMLMKTALLAVFVFVLVSVVWPDWTWRDEARVLLVGYADFAILTQTWIVLQFQGGFRRHRVVKDSTADDSAGG